MEFGWQSLLPPIIAIVLAIVTRRVLISLGISIVVGGALLAWRDKTDLGIFLGTLDSTWNDHAYPALSDKAHLQVFLFSLTLGAMVGVIEAAGGMESLVRRLTRRIRDRRGGQCMVWLLGLAIFFDDYANTLLLGSTMRTAADRLKFSRAKLAYLVDSTAAPVAGLALVSTWVATEVNLIGEGLTSANVNAEVTSFSVFLASIPYRFYACLALVMVAVIAWTGRDFGPMLIEERKCQDENDASVTNAPNDEPPSDQKFVNADSGTLVSVTSEPRWLWSAAVVPVVVCVAIVCGLLVWTGLQSVGDTDLTGLRYWGEVIGNADSYIALVWGSAGGLVFALVIGWMGLQSSKHANNTAAKGC